MFSYWEQQSFSFYDHIVIGAGIVGLNAAIELKQLYPKARVLVLERGILPSGASTRNAGFACMGSASELLDDLSTTSAAEVVSLYAARKTGLIKLRERLGDNHIGYRCNGSHELISEAQLPVLEQIDMLNEMLLPVTGIPAFRRADERIRQFGFAGIYSHALIENTCEGEIHTGMMMRSLTDRAIAAGVEIKTGAEVIGFDEQAEAVTVFVADNIRDGKWQLKCHTLSVCTNAFSKSLLPHEDIKPGRGQILITEPIKGLKIKGIFHFDKGYYYFREIDNRILFGGGRNLDFNGENTTDLNLSDIIQQDLENKLRQTILPGMEYKIAQRWSGIMGFGTTRHPIVKSISDRVFGAFRMGGMGVALGSNAASHMVQLITEKQ